MDKKDQHLLGSYCIACITGRSIYPKKSGCADGFVTSQIKFGSFLYATVFVSWLLNKKKELRRNILSIIGDYSYGIFCCHMFLLWIIRKVLELVG